MTTAVTDAERLARVALSRLAEPGDSELAQLAAEHGVVNLVEAIRSGSLSTPRVANWAVRVGDLRPHTDLENVTRLGGRFVCPGDTEWPPQLDDLAGARPWGLWVRGAVGLRVATARAVAVVGARAATAYGSDVAGDLGAGLAENGWATVSGAAFGVDASAHAGALAMDGTTVAVLACGVDLAYPRAHEGLISRIASEGIVVTELPPGTVPNRPRFLVRNRLIAALGLGVVVVEAAARSGALNTARHAARLNRHVMAVPGPVTSRTSTGAHQLIRSQVASLVTGVDDVLELVGQMGEYLTPEPRGAEHPRDGLDPAVLRVLEALPVRRAVPMSRVVHEAGLASHIVMRSLGVLDALGLAEAYEGGWRLGEEERMRLSRARAGEQS